MRHRREKYGRTLWYALLPALLLGGIILYMTEMPGKSWSGALPPLTAPQARLADRLKKHIMVLSDDIGERNLWRDGTLDATAGYIEETFQAMGYSVVSQVFASGGTSVRNLEAVLGGTSLASEIVLVGAHYDTVRGSPGANDNGSGIAALLEIASLLAARPKARSVHFVAFVNEEMPFFATQSMGSHRYAQRAHGRGDNIRAMLSLETIGYYSDVKGSQQYPNPFYAWLYPDTGNFIGFVGNLASRNLVRQCLGSFRRNSAFPSEGVAAPGRMAGIYWSDHWSFWKEGYAAVMVTDTAIYRYPHYHASTDTAEKIDYERLARVVEGLTQVTADLAQQQ
jgi:Zn-dependent M28 family amino/carboxypeptidase